MQNGDAILGAIVGDIAGSRFEWCNLKSKDFTLLVGRGEDADECCFPDDTVMTVAIAEAISSGVKAAISRMRRSH